MFVCLCLFVSTNQIGVEELENCAIEQTATFVALGSFDWSPPRIFQVELFVSSTSSKQPRRSSHERESESSRAPVTQLHHSFLDDHGGGEDRVLLAFVVVRYHPSPLSRDFYCSQKKRQIHDTASICIIPTERNDSRSNATVVACTHYSNHHVVILIWLSSLFTITKQSE